MISLVPQSSGEMLVFARCAGFISRAPGFSNPAVPPTVRAGFAAVLSLAISHACAKSARPVGAGSLVVAFIVEVLIGATIGVAASALYDGAYAGGKMIDDYVGIKTQVPSADVTANSAFARLWSILFTAAFFMLGGYRVAIDAFSDAFATLPPGAILAPQQLSLFAVNVPVTLVRAALLVAAPAIAVAFTAQLALGILSRIAPRFSSFTLSFPIVFACAIAATVASLPLILPTAATPWFDLSQLRGR